MQLSHVNTRTVRRGVLLGLVAACLTTACSDDERPAAEVLMFRYTDIGGSGFIDQLMTISNPSGNPLVPTVAYTPLDAAGDPLPGVNVSTVYGSDYGGLVIAPGGASFDILMFEGQGTEDVTDVRATVVTVATVDGVTTITEPIEITPFAEGGVAVTKFDPFVSMTIDNANSSAVHVRVVCIQYDTPSDGQAQQVVEVLVLADRVEVAANSATDVDLPAGVAAVLAARGYGCSSLKAHLTP